MGILEKISEIEKEIARTQKNKGTIIYKIEFIKRPCFFSSSSN
jgi:ribosome-interacting GTPase 1